MTPRKPDAVIAHMEGIRIFTDDDLDRLGTVANVLDREAIGRWDDPRAEDLLGRAEVVIGHWGCPVLDASFLAMAPRVGLFAYAAGTVKQTVTESVFERGIRVTSAAQANAEPVAEFTLAAVLFANKQVFWRRTQDAEFRPTGPVPHGGPPVGNWNKTIGIVGASMVGRRVIELLVPFPAITVLLYDPYVTNEQARNLGVTKMPLDELCASVDILSIHAPDLPETRHLIGAKQLAALRDGATVINTARPALIDQDALIAELEQGRLWAVLDVTDPEPLPKHHALRRLRNAYVTPHLAGSQGSELARMTDHVAEEIQRWVSGKPALGEVRFQDLHRLA